jgi:AraC-like DNA-binding protein
VSARGEFATLSFSTEDFPEGERIAMLREHYGRTVLRAEVEPAEGRPFEARIASHILPELHLLAGTLSAARITRTREQTADGNDDCALVACRTGTIAVSSRGRELLLREGEAVLTSSEDVTTFERFATGDSFSLRLPRAVLQPLLVDIDDAVMRLVPQDSKPLRLLTSYASSLMNENALATAPLRHLAVSHLHDLISLTLGPTIDAVDVAKRRGVRAARLREAKVYIANNSFRPDISVATVAAHLGVTPRYLQRLFEFGGSTFSSFLLDQRLRRAHRMLSESRFAERAVSSIAYDVGFGDLSYFNRCFRKVFGVTPTDVRNGDAR